MIELRQDALVVSFPEVHRHAELRIEFQRTLRIPDDDHDHPLPPGLGRFPLRHVDDHAGRVPDRWIEHGGVMLPMYQSEAMWLSFTSEHDYPFAVRIATGKVDAITGEGWRDGLRIRPQNYLSVPTQPWLDGYCVGRGVVRQFVAMPLGAGYSAEEQITGEAEHGGLQLSVRPLRREVWERMQREWANPLRLEDLMPMCAMAPDMGLAPGGRMRQEIHEDPHRPSDWDAEHRSRCFVHIANSMVWRAITGQDPPTVPPTAAEYTRAGLPWFDWYSDAPAVEGADPLAALRSVKRMGAEKGEVPLPENESIEPARVIGLGRRGSARVREGRF